MEKSKIDAIVYMSNAGHTKRYAELLGEKTGLMVVELKKASKEISKGSSIIYMGWLMAGTIKGYKEASRSYSIKAVCGVGMASNGSQMNDIHKMNKIAGETEAFTLQGGFDNERVHGIYKLMMGIASKAAKKGLNDKKELSAEDKEMLDMLANGKDTVSPENLQPVLDWYNIRRNHGI